MKNKKCAKKKIVKSVRTAYRFSLCKTIASLPTHLKDVQSNVNKNLYNYSILYPSLYIIVNFIMGWLDTTAYESIY